MPNIIWFEPLKGEELLLFFVNYDRVLDILMFCTGG